MKISLAIKRFSIAVINLVVLNLAIVGCSDSSSDALSTGELQQQSDPIVVLTEGAKSALLDAVEADGSDFIRVGATPGGCQGCIYDLQVDSQILDSDFVHQSSGLTVVVDEASASLLYGTTLDYVAKGDEQGFVFNRPNMQQKTDANEQ